MVLGLPQGGGQENHPPAVLGEPFGGGHQLVQVAQGTAEEVDGAEDPGYSHRKDVQQQKIVPAGVKQIPEERRIPPPIDGPKEQDTAEGKKGYPGSRGQEGKKILSQQPPGEAAAVAVPPYPQVVEKIGEALPQLRQKVPQRRGPLAEPLRGHPKKFFYPFKTLIQWYNPPPKWSL